MPEVYSKSQMDAIATEIANRIDSNSGLGAAEVDLAIAAYLLANPPAAAKPTLPRAHFNRLYLYTDQRIVSAGDATFGFEDVNSAESAGTGTTPLIEWENFGSPYDAGDKITSIELRLRANNLEVADLEFHLLYVYPDAPTRWTTGFDADGEIDYDVLYSGLYLGRTGAPLIANINDRSRQIFDLDYTCPADGEFRLFCRASTAPTATRYAYTQTIIKHEPA